MTDDAIGPRTPGIGSGEATGLTGCVRRNGLVTRVNLMCVMGVPGECPAPVS